VSAVSAFAPPAARVVDRLDLAGPRDGIRRTLDATFLNRVANDDAVRPWLLGEGQIDLTVLVNDLANVALVTHGGGFFLHQISPGEYEVHSMFLPDARGGTVEAMRAGFAYMFTQTDCHRIVTKVPDGNKAAAGLARIGGFKPLFRREGCWNGRGVAYHAITLDEWAMRAEALEDEGAWFHNRLEDAKREAGSQLVQHGHDPAHERSVGAAVLMFRAGRIGKALAFYNRWAAFAGYTPITIITESPTVLDVGDAVIELRNGDMEVLLCR
jgi:hypothetical protein